MLRKLWAIGLCAVALSACDRVPSGSEPPGASDEDARARADAERQARAAVASVKAATLEDRVSRLEADVDELKAQVGARQNLAAELNQLGTAAPPPIDPAAANPAAALPPPKLSYAPVH